MVMIRRKNKEKIEDVGNPGMEGIKYISKQLFGYNLEDLKKYFSDDDIEIVSIGFRHTYRKKDGRWQELYSYPDQEGEWVDKK